MSDFSDQVLALARELLASAPKRAEGASPWMKRAGHFADTCARDGHLSKRLVHVIPLGKQSEFLDAVADIKDASGTFNIGKVSKVDQGLATIIKLLGPETPASTKHRFSIRDIHQRVEALGVLEKQILDATWNHYVQTGKPFPLRSVQPLIGKTPLSVATQGLNGSHIYEVQENNSRCLTIKLHGALLTGHGGTIASILVQALEFTKDLYEKDSYVAGFDNSQIAKKIGEPNTKLLLRLLRMWAPPKFPLHLSNISGDEATWNVTITDDVMALYQADNIVEYLDDFLSLQYREDEPISYDERLKRELQSSSSLNLSTIFGAATALSKPSEVVSNYIDPRRLEELRSVNRLLKISPNGVREVVS